VSSSIIWTVAVVLLVLWLLGFFVARIGDIVHLLLVLAVIVVLYNLFVGRGRGTTV
jgi:uncharacterized protein DUF5670